MPGVADRRYLQPMYVPEFRTTYSYLLNPFVMCLF